MMNRVMFGGTHEIQAHLLSAATHALTSTMYPRPDTANWHQNLERGSELGAMDADIRAAFRDREIDFVVKKPGLYLNNNIEFRPSSSKANQTVLVSVREAFQNPEKLGIKGLSPAQVKEALDQFMYTFHTVGTNASRDTGVVRHHAPYYEHLEGYKSNVHPDYQGRRDQGVPLFNVLA